MTLLRYPDIAYRALMSSTEPSSCKEAWTRDFDRQATHAIKRAENGPRNAQTYGVEVVEAGIRKAIGTLPANGVRATAAVVTAWIEEKGPAFFGLRRKPDVEKVRAVIKQMERERQAALQAAWWPRSSD